MLTLIFYLLVAQLQFNIPVDNPVLYSSSLVKLVERSHGFLNSILNSYGEHPMTSITFVTMQFLNPIAPDTKMMEITGYPPKKEELA